MLFQKKNKHNRSLLAIIIAKRIEDKDMRVIPYILLPFLSIAFNNAKINEKITSDKYWVDNQYIYFGYVLRNSNVDTVSL